MNEPEEKQKASPEVVALMALSGPGLERAINVQRRIEDQKKRTMGPWLRGRVSGVARILRQMRKPRTREEHDAERRAQEHAKLMAQKFGQETRQQRHHVAFGKAFISVCRQYGGGPGWAGSHTVLRRARRRIARRLAKLALKGSKETAR